MQTISAAISYLKLDSWVAQVFIIVFLTLLLNYFLKKILVKIHTRLGKTNTYWDDALIDAILPPMTVIIWVLGLTLAAEIVQSETGAPIFLVIPVIRTIGVIFCLAWFLVRFIRRIEENIIYHKTQEEISFDRTTIDAIGKLLRISVIITAILVALQSLGYSISGVLAFGGVGGIIVGFAAKDLLSNFFGGLMIYLDRPFSVGDWIRSPDKEIEGNVEQIGWRLTVIRTFDKRPLYVPNSIFTMIAVENPSRMTNRRIYETVGIRYADAGKMADIVAAVKKMLVEHDEIDTSQTLIVNFNKFATSSLDFFIYALTKTTNWIKFHEVKQDVLLKTINIIEDHGAECAFPTSTIQIPDGISMTEK
jgi:MscS family membrane protein